MFCCHSDKFNIIPKSLTGNLPHLSCCCLLLAIGKSINKVLSVTYLVLIPINENTKLKR